MNKTQQLIAIFLIQLSNGTEKGRLNSGGIGNAGKLLYNKKEVPGDMERFVELSMGKTLIVGPKTYEGFYRKPPPGRNTIVVSRSYPSMITKIQEGLYHINDIKNAVAAARELFPNEDIVAAGGVPIFNTLIGICDKLYTTEVYGDKDADVKINFFKSGWKQVNIVHNEHNNLKYDFVDYEQHVPKNPEDHGDGS